MLIAVLLISFFLSSSALKCVDPADAAANITAWASSSENQSLTIFVKENYLNQSYCADVINWPISEDSLANWSAIEQGLFYGGFFEF